MLISGVAADKDVSRISLVGVKDKPGIAFEVFSLMAREKISVDIILQSIGRDDTKDISFTVSKSDLEQTLKVLKENQQRLTAQKIMHDDKIAKLSVVGAGMATNPGVASLFFEALYDADVNISMISTSEIKISVLIDESEVDVAMNSVHDKFKTATASMRKQDRKSTRLNSSHS